MSRLAILHFSDSVNWGITNFFKDIDKIRLIKVTKDTLITNIEQTRNMYDKVMVVGGNESLGSVLSTSIITIKFHKGMDSVLGDLEQISRNPLHIISQLVYKLDYAGVNSLGYVKNKITKIEPNYHTRDGGIWVKTKEECNVYIPLSLFPSINIIDLDFYNVINSSGV